MSTRWKEFYIANTFLWQRECTSKRMKSTPALNAPDFITRCHLRLRLPCQLVFWFSLYCWSLHSLRHASPTAASCGCKEIGLDSSSGCNIIVAYWLQLVRSSKQRVTFEPLYERCSITMRGSPAKYNV